MQRRKVKTVDFISYDVNLLGNSELFYDVRQIPTMLVYPAKQGR